MICDNCKSKPAEVFLTQIVEGKMQKVNLCKACSKDKGVDDPTGFQLAELLLGLGESTEVSPATGGVMSASKALAQVGGGSGGGAEAGGEREGGGKCPVCGFTQSDFKKTGRLGCSECYGTFGDSLGALLKAMHKGTAHTGKVPARLHRAKVLNGQMKTLRTDLEKAVRDENYEGAADLRDKIRQIENQLGK